MTIDDYRDPIEGGLGSASRIERRAGAWLSPDEQIQDAVRDFLSASASATEAASFLQDKILEHHKERISEASLLRETAALLLHAGQTFGPSFSLS
jgi:maltooligosyltrehalose synthase